MQKTWVRSLSWEDPLQEDMAIHSSILAWRIPRTGRSLRATVQGHRVRLNSAGMHTENCRIKWKCTCVHHDKTHIPFSYSTPKPVLFKEQTRNLFWEINSAQEKNLSLGVQGNYLDISNEQGKPYSLTGRASIQLFKGPLLNKHWLPRNTRHLKKKKSNTKDKAQSQQTEKGNLEKREYSEKKCINNSLREKRYYIHETKEYYHLNFFRKKKYLEIINIIAEIKP